MKRGLLGLVSGWLLFCGVPIGPVRAAQLRLTVRVNNLAGFDAATLTRAERIAGRIFEEAGVWVEWQSATESGTLPAGLGSTSEKHELRINLVAIRPAAMGGQQDEAAFAALPGGGRSGYLAWVFQPTLEKIIDDTQYLTPQRVRSRLREVVLGHVMAHEMGHLLLGSAEHSNSGIMTLGWDLRKFRLACVEGLRFTPQQSGKIRAAVQTMKSANYESANRPPR